MTTADEDFMKANKKFLAVYDQSDKTGLTKGQGLTAYVDYLSSQNIYHGKELSKDPRH